MVARVPGTVLVTGGGRTASESAGGVVVLLGGPVVQSESVYVDGHSYGSLRGRTDDRPDAAKRRVDTYLAQTWPVVSYYEARGLLHRIDGSQSVDHVQQRIVEALGPQPHDVEARAGQ